MSTIKQKETNQDDNEIHAKKTEIARPVKKKQYFSNENSNNQTINNIYPKFQNDQTTEKIKKLTPLQQNNKVQNQAHKPYNPPTQYQQKIPLNMDQKNNIYQKQQIQQKNNDIQQKVSKNFQKIQENQGINNNNINNNQQNYVVQEEEIFEGCKEFQCYIQDLNFYMEAWVITARVINKSQLKNYTSKNNTAKVGQVFSCDLIDDSKKSRKSTISCSFFGESCEKYFNLINEGAVYDFVGGVLKQNQNKQFNKPHDLTIIFTDNSNIRKSRASINQLQKIPLFEPYEFETIQNIIENKKQGEIIDFIGCLNKNPNIKN
ncbi:Nucleic acid-binding, OB-fold [Pseudocohnilembus persalinus]|uniref:Nucleic acid-binding, OB-fold n=1 Tax=Pseudocohnilembus persalinus TaxID=266149 RepID=A0A0V0QRD6_PSEPJ|nr:Nucleic acid-binding, OB-fold [Pseudocohnilembus persalinus]|eukprot:KRX04878.1 Nucleic acid-binding, OB-fold [Pseudocohnilembus persalinus]